MYLIKFNNGEDVYVESKHYEINNYVYYFYNDKGDEDYILTTDTKNVLYVIKQDKGE